VRLYEGQDTECCELTTMMMTLQKKGEGPKTLHYPAGLPEEFDLQRTAETFRRQSK
jgi:hypothetical protein